MTISYGVAEPVATITLHREEKLNALDYAMIDDLQPLLDVVAAGVAEGLARFLDRRPAASTESAATPGDRS